MKRTHMQQEEENHEETVEMKMMKKLQEEDKSDAKINKYCKNSNNYSLLLFYKQINILLI